MSLARAKLSVPRPVIASHLLHLLQPLYLPQPLHLLDDPLHLLQPLDELSLRLSGEVRLLYHKGFGAEIKLHTGLGFLRTGEYGGQIQLY